MAGKSASVRIFGGIGHCGFRTKNYRGNTSRNQDRVLSDDQLYLIMRKWDLWKAIRICSWVARFVWNSRTKHQPRITGPITTEETTKQLQFWARRSEDRAQPNLRKTSCTLTHKRMQQVYSSAEAVSREFIQSIYLMMLYLLRSSSCTPTSKPCRGELD